MVDRELGKSTSIRLYADQDLWLLEHKEFNLNGFLRKELDKHIARMKKLDQIEKKDTNTQSHISTKTQSDVLGGGIKRPENAQNNSVQPPTQRPMATIADSQTSSPFSQGDVA